MLNERQLKIVDLLEQQPRTPGELAQQTGVSGRTILRDIDYLNFTLNGKARIFASGSAGYQLEIFERRSFFQLLQKHDNDDRLLALLLLNTFTPRAQLASALNLPETWVAERLPRLKQRYERTCCLASRPGLGHFIDETEEKRVILLANLLRKDRSASACRKAAKRIRSKSSAHCVAKLFTRNLFINCNRAIPTRCLPC